MANLNQGSILVIDPGTRVAELDCFNYISQRSKTPCTYHLPAINGFSSLRCHKGPIKAIIILGSGASVYDDLEWQGQLRKFVEPHFSKKTPILGICYGHQLIAHMFGAEIGLLDPDGKKEEGVRKIELKTTERLGISFNGNLIISHKEVVKKCPEGFVTIAKSPKVEIEALEHIDFPIWTFQAHPEATDEFLNNQNIRISNLPAKEEAFKNGHLIINKFLETITD